MCYMMWWQNIKKRSCLRCLGKKMMRFFYVSFKKHSQRCGFKCGFSSTWCAPRTMERSPSPSCESGVVFSRERRIFFVRVPYQKILVEQNAIQSDSIYQFTHIVTVSDYIRLYTNITYTETMQYVISLNGSPCWCSLLGHPNPEISNRVFFLPQKKTRLNTVEIPDLTHCVLSFWHFQKTWSHIAWSSFAQHEVGNSSKNTTPKKWLDVWLQGGFILYSCSLNKLQTNVKHAEIDLFIIFDSFPHVILRTPRWTFDGSCHLKNVDFGAFGIPCRNFPKTMHF